MALPKFAFFKGRIVPYSEAKIGVLTHTFNYGTGAFGGLRGYWNEEAGQLYVFRPLDHFHRFLESGKLLCMKLPYSKEDLVQIRSICCERRISERIATYVRSRISRMKSSESACMISLPM